MDLTTFEHGIYTLLLDFCYATEQPIPNFLASLRICKISRIKDLDISPEEKAEKEQKSLKRAEKKVEKSDKKSAKKVHFFSSLETGKISGIKDLSILSEKKAEKKVEKSVKKELKKEQKSLKRILRRYFILTEAGYIHPRVEKERKLAESRTKASRDNGKYGGRPRKSETQQVFPGLFENNLEKSSPLSNHHINPPIVPPQNPGGLSH